MPCWSCYSSWRLLPHRRRITPSAAPSTSASRRRSRACISKIDWVNPHVYIYLDVKDNNGKVTTWGLESLPTNHLRSVGLTRQDIWNNASEGEVVTVHVNPAKDLANHQAGWLLRITYADGHFFHLSGDPKEIAESK